MIAIISIIFFVATVISRQPDAADSCPIQYEGELWQKVPENSETRKCNAKPEMKPEV